MLFTICLWWQSKFIFNFRASSAVVSPVKSRTKYYTFGLSAQILPFKSLETVRTKVKCSEPVTLIILEQIAELYKLYSGWGIMRLNQIVKSAHNIHIVFIQTQNCNTVHKNIYSVTLDLDYTLTNNSVIFIHCFSCLQWAYRPFLGNGIYKWRLQCEDLWQPAWAGSQSHHGDQASISMGRVNAQDKPPLEVTYTVYHTGPEVHTLDVWKPGKVRNICLLMHQCMLNKLCSDSPLCLLVHTFFLHRRYSGHIIRRTFIIHWLFSCSWY